MDTDILASPYVLISSPVAVLSFTVAGDNLLWSRTTSGRAIVLVAPVSTKNDLHLLLIRPSMYKLWIPPEDVRLTVTMGALVLEVGSCPLVSTRSSFPTAVRSSYNYDECGLRRRNSNI
uniref:Uncharacterized protein LOC114345110 n=1 Tax=Diabrotica virgifera virgifera TaxID=50390 RepID=A0A6P7GPA8_DIAVI